MNRSLLTHGAAVVVGLLAGWLLWGRGVSPAEVARVTARAVQAELLAKANALEVAALKRRWTEREPEIRALIDSARQLRNHMRERAHDAELHGAAAEALAAAGDTAAALRATQAQVQAITLAYEGCLEATRLDTLALARCQQSSAEKDTALALHGQTIDSLVNGSIGLRETLARLRPRRWAVGPVFQLGHLAPVGGGLDRDIGPARIRLEVTDGPSEDLTGRLAIGLRF
jgi:hypothetical protein